jgi:hypothetical protein
MACSRTQYLETQGKPSKTGSGEIKRRQLLRRNNDRLFGRQSAYGLCKFKIRQRKHVRIFRLDLSAGEAMRAAVALAELEPDLLSGKRQRPIFKA